VSPWVYMMLLRRYHLTPAQVDAMTPEVVALLMSGWQGRGDVKVP
jgi:hypothetical protein